MSRPLVLILEDEPLIAMLVEDWLVELGYEPVGPYSRGTEALEVVRSQDLDAAILDIPLKNDTCYPVADALMSNNVPFAFATGRSDDDAIPSRLEGTPMLRKPYNLQAMRTVLEALLRKPDI